MTHEDLRELFSAFGPVAIRRMFGGAGIFADGLMFAIVSDGVIYLKADPDQVPHFEREGMSAFTYRTKMGERALTSYWRMPERLYDDPEELAQWARRAAAAAQRNAGARPQPAKRFKRTAKTKKANRGR